MSARSALGDSTRQLGNDALESGLEHLALRSLFDTAPSGLCVLDPELRLISVNAKLAQMIGAPAQSLLGRAFADVVPEIADYLRHVGERMAASGVPVPGEEISFAAGSQPGEPRTWFASWFPVKDQGRIRCIHGRLEDTTEGKRAQAKALEVQGELQAVTALMDAGVTRCTADMRYRWVSPTYAKRLGFRPEDMAGRLIRDIVGDAAMDALHSIFAEVLSGERVEYEGQVTYKTIGARWVHANYVPSRDAQGTVDGWVAVVTDITQRKELELKLLEADRRKNEFIAVLAHELRNPLAPLRNGVEIIRLSARQDSALLPTVDMMDRQLTHLVRLIDDLLDVSRITRGKVDLRRTPIALGDVLVSSVESCRPLIAADGHELIVDMPSEQLIVDADFDRMSQVFANLLSNSGKFTKRGGCIRLSLERQGDEAVVEVSDNGMGIPPARLHDIFEMFSQVRSDHGGSHEGLGIGLALVRNLVEMHGGSVSAFSRGPGTGSRFTVRLPLVRAPAGAASPLPGAPGDAGTLRSARRHLRILVVDDNADAASTLAMLLRLRGHQAIIAGDGCEALERAQMFRPELIFLDIGMPGLDGYETASCIRQQQWGRSTCLVALTGWGQDEAKQRALEVGFDAHFTKPLDPTALEELLERICDGRPPARRPAAEDAGQAGLEAVEAAVTGAGGRA